MLRGHYQQQIPPNVSLHGKCIKGFSTFEKTMNSHAANKEANLQHWVSKMLARRVQGSTMLNDLGAQGSINSLAIFGIKEDAAPLSVANAAIQLSLLNGVPADT